MKKLKLRTAALAALAFGLAPWVASAMWMKQTIPLKAGWNAVHVKVNPYDYGCDVAFGGGGIDQVTWWNRDHRDDGTGTVSADSYAWYRSSAEPNTFGAVLGDERYLVHAVAATNLVIFGTPALPRGRVFGGELNLLGPNVPASGEVSANDYFRYLPVAGGSLTCYRVLSNGTHQRLSNAYELSANPSEAIWVEADGEGARTYRGPLDVELDTGDKTLVWDASSAAREITVRNVTDIERKVKFAFETSLAPPAGQGTKAGDIKLKIESLDWSAGYARRVYTPVSFPFVTNLAAGATFSFRVRPNLDAMPGADGDYLGILAVSDAGSTIDYETRAAGTCLCRVGLRSNGRLGETVEPTGLWVGQVALTGVNRAQMLTSAKSEWKSDEVIETTQAFQFRMIVHVANSGEVKLMKEAYIGSETSDNATATVMADRASAVSYRGFHPNATIRRVSSANFPFMAPKAFENPTGFMKAGEKLRVVFTQQFDAKDNPFQHQFHPNHDNLAFNNGAPSKKEDGGAGTGDYESWPVTREVTLEFLGADPTGPNEDWNRTVCGGIYTETVTGLNKTPIITEGAFRLMKRLDTVELREGM